MSTASLASPTRAVVLVLAAGLSIGAWAVHLFALTSLARLDEQHHGVVWIMHAITVVCLIPCVAALGVGWVSLRPTRTTEGEGSPIGRTVFLAWMTIVIAAFNVVLIVVEAAYVVLLGGHA